MMRRIPLFALVALAAGCSSHRDAARADSLQAIAHEQAQLTNQLAAQKDSLTRVIFEADDLISRVDSQISTVKGLPTAPKRKNLESPIEERLGNGRQQSLERIALTPPFLLQGQKPLVVPRLFCHDQTKSKFRRAG